MSDMYGPSRSESLQSMIREALDTSVCTAPQNDRLIRDAITFCEKLCDEFNRRWNINERFYRSKQRRAERLFIVEELAIASDSERTISRRYPEHLRSTLKAIAALTSTCEALHKLRPDCVVVIANGSSKRCVPVHAAIIRSLSELEAVGRSAPRAKPAKAA